MIKLSHICISSPDIEATFDFFRRIFNSKLVYEFRREDIVYGKFIVVSKGNFIEIFRDNTVNFFGNPVIRHFCFSVDDLQHFETRLTQNQIKYIASVGRIDRTPQLMIDGPFGLKIELHQITSHSLLADYI